MSFVSDHDTCHNVFKKNPLELKNMVNKIVRVHYKSGCVEGTVYTIDPVSQTVALFVRDGTTSRVDLHLVFEKHIKSIELIGESDFTVMQDLFDKSNNMLPQKVKDNRCDKLVKWLKANMIPIEKEGDILKLADVLTIHPPYESDNCISKNVIILEKIQNLIVALNKA